MSIAGFGGSVSIAGFGHSEHFKDNWGGPFPTREGVPLVLPVILLVMRSLLGYSLVTCLHLYLLTKHLQPLQCDFQK